ncbi:hypothetical protein ACQE3E_06550 [Methylomonas sp. MED-D]|uniref:hypothetical protein n=1 Tax=Methylomonas sp. MED-D TaxID=3418768 RepID=UPI003D03F494
MSEEHQYQHRAIVGERTFVLANSSQPGVYAIPGQVEYQGIGPNGRPIRLFRLRTATLADLERFAARRGERLELHDRFPIMRSAAWQ